MAVQNPLCRALEKEGLNSLLKKNVAYFGIILNLTIKGEGKRATPLISLKEWSLKMIEHMFHVFQHFEPFPKYRGWEQTYRHLV